MIFNVRVIPRSSRNRIQQEGNNLKAHLTKPAQQGLANEQLIELLSDYFKVKKYQIRIKSGEKSRDKLVEILSLRQIMGTLAERIFERDKERGRRRSLALCQGRVTQSQPKIRQPICINEGEARLSAVCGVASPRRSAVTTPSSSRLAYGLNPGFQCAHYLPEAQ